MKLQFRHLTLVLPGILVYMGEKAYAIYKAAGYFLPMIAVTERRTRHSQGKTNRLLTKNGEGDLVVMDIETFARRESMLRLRENLIAAEESRANGKSGYSIYEVSNMMKDVVGEVLDVQRK